MFQTTKDQAPIVIIGAVRPDGVEYTVRLRSDSGVAEGTVKVTVLGESSTIDIGSSTDDELNCFYLDGRP